MIEGCNIVCISSIDWDFIWQGHQEIMSTLAAHGNRVLFVENTGVRPVRVGDIGRIRSRIRNWLRSTKGFREERQNLFVYSPVLFPFPYSSVARRINAWMLLRALRRWMRAAGFHNPIAWTFLPTPLARALIQGLEPKLTVYYCIDDLASSSQGARKITASENQVFAESDLVFVTSEKLRQKAAAFSEHVHLFPFAVKYDAFERVRLSADGLPTELRDLPKPVIGYVGGLHQWVDQRLVCAVADAMPEASVALVGPPQTDISELQRRRNVHVLGARPHAELPNFIKGFDVALVPYLLSEYTDHVYPTKLNEYLAMGVPVVTTELPEIRRFNERHGQIVSTAGEPEAFVAAVRDALRRRSPDEAARRVAVAQENSWANRIEEMSTLMEAAIADRAGTAERWDVALRRMYRTTRRRTLQVAGALLAAYILFFQTPLLWVVAAPLRVAEHPTPADAIVVFGGGVGESGKALGSYQERVREGVDLYKRGLGRKIVFMSGFVYFFQETEVMKGLAVAEGVPPADIVLETRGGSTRQYAITAALLAREQGWRRVLLVSSPYHMRRATLTWRKAVPGVDAVATPATRSQFYDHGLGASFEQVSGITHEYTALAYYWLKGWI